MIPERVIPSFATAGSLIGAAVVVFGQAIFDPSTAWSERVIGGSVLLLAAGLIVKWTFRLIKEVRVISAEDREASLKRESLHMQQIAELNAQLAAERRMRLSLEQLGLTNRRHTDERLADEE